MRVAKLILSLGLAFLSWTASAAEYKAGDVVVADPWARASAAMSGAAGVFMTVRNDGAGADRLVDVSSDAAGMTDLHKTMADGDVMRMVKVPFIDIPAHGMAVLKPGELHVMLMDLKAPLHAGTSFRLTLKFERAGEISVDVPVMAMGAKGAMGHAMPAQAH